MDSTDYVSQLKTNMRVCSTAPLRIQRNTHVPPTLATATHVFVRNDAVRKPLQAQYEGPYSVLEWTEKFYILNINGHTDAASID